MCDQIAHTLSQESNHRQGRSHRLQDNLPERLGVGGESEKVSRGINNSQRFTAKITGKRHWHISQLLLNFRERWSITNHHKMTMLVIHRFISIDEQAEIFLP